LYIEGKHSEGELFRIDNQLSDVSDIHQLASLGSDFLRCRLAALVRGTAFAVVSSVSLAASVLGFIVAFVLDGGGPGGGLTICPIHFATGFNGSLLSNANSVHLTGFGNGGGKHSEGEPFRRDIQLAILGSDLLRCRFAIVFAATTAMSNLEPVVRARAKNERNLAVQQRNIATFAKPLRWEWRVAQGTLHCALPRGAATQRE